MPEQRRYKVTDDQFGRSVLTLRERARLTQAEVAAAIGVSERAVQQWEAGLSFPSGDNLKKLIATYLHRGALTAGRERDEAVALWEQVAERASRLKSLFDNAWFDALLAQPQAAQGRGERLSTAHRGSNPVPVLLRADWGEAPDGSVIYGRERDLDTLNNWVLAERCRVVAVLGMGGIGKTTLAVHFAQSVALQFTHVVWRSLRNAPPLAELLADCLHVIGENQALALPISAERGITHLIELMRRQRCLLVLDDVDSLLEGGSLMGHYRAGCEGYQQLFQRVAETSHQSCLILTSREMLSELEALEGREGPVRALKLSSLPYAAGRDVLKDKDLYGTSEVWGSFIEHYAGNPLALKIAGATVRELFGGDLAAFLHEGPVTLHTLQQVLDDQLRRLTPLERDIMTWLAVERDLVTTDELAADFLGTVLKKDLLTALKALRRRSLVERDERGTAFTLQPVVLEHVSDWLVNQIGQELVAGRFSLTTNYALLKCQSKDYIRESQARMLVQPLLSRLRSHFDGGQRLEAHLHELLGQLRNQPELQQGYAAGTIVNLLVALRGNLRGVDCSRLVLRQAYLQGIEAQEASFAGAEVHEAHFTAPLETISTISLSRNGAYLAVGGCGGHVHVWRVATGELVWSAKGHTRMAWGLAFNSDGTLLASGGYQGRVHIWNAANGRRVTTFQAHHGWVRTVAFSQDGSKLATAGDDATIRIWDLLKGTHLRVLQGHRGIVWEVAFSPDGATLVTVGVDGTLRVWDVMSGVVQQVFQQEAAIFSLAMHPLGRLVACGSENGQITLWDLEHYQQLTVLQRQTRGLASLAFNPEGTLLACGGNNGGIELWQMGSENIRQFIGILEGHQWLVSSVSFATNNLLASTAYGGQVKLWDTEHGKLLKTIQGYSQLITALAYSPDARLLAQGEDNGRLRIWDIEQGRCLVTLQGHSGPVWAITWSSDGTVFASGGDDREVKLWEANTWRCAKRFGGHEVVVWALAFNSQGTVLASGSGDKLIRLYHTRDDDDVEQPEVLSGANAQILSLAFSPDGRMLASGQLNGILSIIAGVSRQAERPRASVRQCARQARAWSRG